MSDSNVRIISSCTPKSGSCDVTIGGLTREEKDTVESSMLGAHWIRKNHETGRLDSVNYFKPLPAPADDTLLPWWREQPKTQRMMFATAPDEPPNYKWNASIVIEHLCGYNYTPERYKLAAERLESYGFHCLRSRRGAEGRFWEQWVLHLFEAAGDLRAHLKEPERDWVNDNEETQKKAVEYLRTNVPYSFGSLSLQHQVLAMVMD